MRSNKLHHAAGAGLERLAVGPVHGAEADVLELRAAVQVRLVRGAKHLLEMPVLALIDDIKNEIGIVLDCTRSTMVARSVVP